MKTLVIYDSTFGNTERIAKAIATGAGEAGEADAVRVTAIRDIDWQMVSALIVGSPTQGGRSTKAIQDFLSHIPDQALQGIVVAGFDTRFEEAQQNFALRLLMKTIQYAGEKILNQLKQKGGNAAGSEGFIVAGKEGPLKDGELERARAWGNAVVSGNDNEHNIV